MSSQLCSCPNNASYCVVPSMGSVMGIYNQPFNLVVYVCNNTTNNYTATLQLLDASSNVNCSASNLTVLPGDNVYSLTGCKITSTPGQTQTWTLQLSLSGGITVTSTIQVHAINQQVTYFAPYQYCCVSSNQPFTVQEICTTPAGGSCPTSQISLGKVYTINAPVGLPTLFSFSAFGVAPNETLSVTVTYYFTNGNTLNVVKQFTAQAYVTISDVLNAYLTNGSVSYVTFIVTSSLGSSSNATVYFAAYVPCACGTPLQVSVPYQISVTLNDSATNMAQVFASLLYNNNVIAVQSTTVQPAIPPAYVTGSFQMTSVQPLGVGIMPAVLNVYASNYNTPDATIFLALGIQSGAGLGSFAIVADCGTYMFCPCQITVSVQNLTGSGVTGYIVAYYGTNNQVKSGTITLQPNQKQSVTLSINVSKTTPVTINFVDANTGNVLATTQCTVNVQGFTYILNEIMYLAIFSMMFALLGGVISALRRRRSETERERVIIVR